MVKEINLTDLGEPIQGEIPGLRDFFATSALTLFSYKDFDRMGIAECDYIAQVCYDIADSMMEEKAARKQK